MVDIPELPFHNIHKFLAAVGIVLILPALFLEPVYVNSRDVLTVGVTGLAIGLVGWMLESVLIPYGEAIEENGTSRQIERVVKPIFKWVLAFRIILPLLFLFALLIFL